MEAQRTNTIDPDEIARFSAIADEWWDTRGKFAPLHKINPVRIQWLKDEAEPAGKTLLDIGCGGGLISEPMARLGAKVTAVDASEKNIAVAKLHAEKMGLSIDYRCSSAEQLNEQFDVVLALEIIEHVSDIPAFVAATCKLVKPGGKIFYSTINRTTKSYAMAIVGAEYILRWLPKGTHTWSKFVKPHELVRELEKNGITITDMRGMVMNPLSGQWRWEKNDLSVNYALSGIKA